MKKSELMNNDIVRNLFYTIENRKFIIYDEFSIAQNELEFIPSFMDFDSTRSPIDICIKCCNPNKYNKEQIMIMSIINYCIRYFAKGKTDATPTKYFLAYQSLMLDKVYDEDKNESNNVYSQSLNFLLYNLLTDKEVDEIEIPEYCLFNLLKYYYIYLNMKNIYESELRQNAFLHYHFTTFKYLKYFLSLNSLFSTNKMIKFLLKKNIDELKMEVFFLSTRFNNMIIFKH